MALRNYLRRADALALATALLVIGGCCSAGNVSEAPRGALIGGKLYTPTTLYSAPEMNLIYDLQLYHPTDGSPPQILAACSDGFRVLSGSGQLLRFRPWSEAWGGSVVFTHGKPGFVVQYAYSASPYYYDWEGHVRWHTDLGDLADIAPLHSAGGELAGFVAGSQPTLLNPSGKKVRPLRSRFDWCFEAAEVHTFGRDDPLVALQMAGGWLISLQDLVQIVDMQGKLVASWPTNFPYFRFGTVQAAHGPTDRLLFIRHNSIEVRDLYGKVVETRDAPQVNYFGAPKGYRWTDRTGDRSLLVLTDSHQSNHLHGVYIYDAAGALIYCYFGDDNAASLVVLPNGAPGDMLPTFLVGVRGRIMKFTPS
jgi:hypothetical protein